MEQKVYDMLLSMHVYDFLDQYDDENKLRIIITSKKLNYLQKWKLINDNKLITKDKNRYSEKLEDIIKKHPIYAYEYAKNVIRGRWIEAEEYIKTDSCYAFFYALDVIQGRWIEAEPFIKTNPEYAYCYAKDVIKGRWIEAEPYIKKDPRSACWYAQDVIEFLGQDVSEFLGQTK